jgi:hypothetical protein
MNCKTGPDDGYPELLAGVSTNNLVNERNGDVSTVIRIWCPQSGRDKNCGNHFPPLAASWENRLLRFCWYISSSASPKRVSMSESVIGLPDTIPILTDSR